MAKARAIHTHTTPDLRLRATVWVLATDRGNRYDVLLERGGKSWRFKDEHVKVAADNLTARHLGQMLATAARMFPREMHDLLLSALREVDKSVNLDAKRCGYCPVSGECLMCGWSDGEVPK